MRTTTTSSSRRPTTSSTRTKSTGTTRACACPVRRSSQGIGAAVVVPLLIFFSFLGDDVLTAARVYCSAGKEIVRLRRPIREIQVPTEQTYGGCAAVHAWPGDLAVS